MVRIPLKLNANHFTSAKINAIMNSSAEKNPYAVIHLVVTKTADTIEWEKQHKGQVRKCSTLPNNHTLIFTLFLAPLTLLLTTLLVGYHSHTYFLTPSFHLHIPLFFSHLLHIYLFYYTPLNILPTFLPVSSSQRSQTRTKCTRCYFQNTSCRIT